MKKLKLFIGVMIVGLSFNACQQDDDLEFVAKEASGLTFNTTFLENYILNPSVGNNLAERFTWNSADFSVPTNVTYSLQAATMPDFSDYVLADPIYNLGSTQGNELAVTVSKMIALAEAAGLDNDPNTDDIPNVGQVYFRLMAVVGDNGLASYSPVQSLNIELQEGEAEVQLPKLYIVGNFLAASGYGEDWKAPNAVPIASSGEGNDEYEGYVYMNVDSPEFKILPTNESFDGDYGDDGTFSGTLIQEEEKNILLSGAGYYFIKVNLSTLTYTAEITNWAVTGSATPAGWPDNGVEDQDMTYNPTTGKWEITIALTAGADDAFKFRANNAWALNYGDAGADGILDFNDGTNLTVDAAGTYLIEVDFSNPRMYTYTLTLQ